MLAALRLGNSMGTLSQQLAEHFHSTVYEDLPAAVIQRAKLTLLDTLGVAWAGLDASGCAPVRELGIALGGRPDANIWGSEHRLPAPEAAFVNGVAAAALDYDALHVAGTVHADIVAVPALLAVAEQVQAHGRAWLTSYVLAQDLICRLGLSVQRYDGWFNTSVLGVFGAAAGAAQLLRLNPAGIANAIGLALPQAGGTQQPMLEQSQVKRLQSAFAARAGVHAALLAQQGLNAPAQALEGQFGLFNKYTGNTAEHLLQDLGEHWTGADIAIKRYPNCGCSHGPLDLALELIDRHGLRTNDVEHIEVTLPAFSHGLVGAPFAPADNPQVSAQFSVRYALAVALRDRQFGLQHIEAASALDPTLAALANKVSVKTDPNAKGRMYPLSLSIDVQGQRYSAHAASEPDGVLSEQQILSKVRSCFAYSSRPDSVANGERLIGQVLELEKLGDVRQLLAPS